MDSVTVFSFQDAHEIRVQTIDGEPWFCLKDVCEVLSIDRASDLVRVAKGVVLNQPHQNRDRGSLDPEGVRKTDSLTNGGLQQIVFINEPNLYRVIFRSNKPEARQFQNWVFNEVLPEIRKTGSYGLVASGNEPITGEQKRELVYIVGQIANQFHFKRAWVSAIWYAIRRATCSKPPAPLTTDDLPAVKRELERILGVAEQLKTATENMEKDVLRMAIRDGKPIGKALRKANKAIQSPAVLPAKLELLIDKICNYKD